MRTPWGTSGRWSYSHSAWPKYGIRPAVLSTVTFYPRFGIFSPVAAAGHRGELLLRDDARRWPQDALGRRPGRLQEGALNVGGGQEEVHGGAGMEFAKFAHITLCICKTNYRYMYYLVTFCLFFAHRSPT